MTFHPTGGELKIIFGRVGLKNCILNLKSFVWNQTLNLGINMLIMQHLLNKLDRVNVETISFTDDENVENIAIIDDVNDQPEEISHKSFHRP